MHRGIVEFLCHKAATRVLLPVAWSFRSQSNRQTYCENPIALESIKFWTILDIFSIKYCV